MTARVQGSGLGVQEHLAPARTGIFTHAACLDGVASALLVKHLLPDAEVVFVDYSTLGATLRGRLDDFDVFWFTDLSFNDETLIEAWRQAGKRYTWLDHHSTSRKLAEKVAGSGLLECVVDASGKRCAAEIVLEFLEQRGHAVPESLRVLTRLAHDRDLWARALPEALAIEDVLFGLGAPELLRLLHEDPDRVFHWTPEMCRAREESAGRRERSIALARATCRQSALPGGEPLRVALCSGFASEVAEALDDGKGAVALVNAEDLAAGKPRLHLRGKGEVVDLSRVAEALGGGGHPRAAGAPLPEPALAALCDAVAKAVCGTLA